MGYPTVTLGYPGIEVPLLAAARGRRTPLPVAPWRRQGPRAAPACKFQVAQAQLLGLSGLRPRRAGYPGGPAWAESKQTAPLTYLVASAESEPTAAGSGPLHARVT